MKQIETTLPASDWRNIPIVECGEPLVLVPEMPKLRTGLVSKDYQPSFLVRTGVLKKLIEASKRLPEGVSLVLIEGWRSTEHQQMDWDKVEKLYKQNHPKWSPEELERQVGLVVAKPKPLANHHCGGAIDVTLADDNGNLLDMGSPYISSGNSDEWSSRYPMLSPLITPEQATNRKILRDAMEAVDFAWYPKEWWHYSWNDRMWAGYKGKEVCGYGSIEPDPHQASS